MVRQFRIRPLNEALPDFRSWVEQLFAGFGDSALALAFQRLDLGFAPKQPDGRLESPGDRPVDSPGDRPVDSPDGRPVDSPDGRPVDSPDGRPVATGTPLDRLLSGTAIAVMDGSGRGPRDVAPFGSSVGSESGRYQILYGLDFENPLIVDTVRMELIQSGRAGGPELGAGSSDTLFLGGPFEDAMTLPLGLRGLEEVVLRTGASYDISSLDDHVGGGARLTVDATRLGPDDSLRFDGGSERDGAFIFLGGGGDDIFLGGAGNDRIKGGEGADTLRGGGGADVFVYESAAASSGAGHDSLLGFNASEDRIDLPVAVSGFDAAVLTGALSAATLDADLAAALGGLGAGRAVVYAPDAGDLAGNVFLVVDGNGEAGYQAGEDFLFALPGAAVADIGTSAAIFI